MGDRGARGPIVRGPKGQPGPPGLPGEYIFLSLYDYHHAQLHITKVKQPKNKIIKPTLLNLIY